MQPITDKQNQVLAAIRRYIAVKGQSPTVREIGEEVGLSSSCSVQKHLDALERLGRITRGTFKYRSIEIVDENGDGHRRAAQTVMIPMLGRVIGGNPEEVVLDIDPELFPIPASFVGRGERDQQAAACSAGEFIGAPYFAMTVKGQSMQGAGISEGDIVVARRQHTAHNGDIVIAQIGRDDATVKRYFREGDAVRLQPENPDFEPLITRDVTIVGRVTMAIKQF